MISVTQHLPNFVDGERKTAQCSDPKNLLDISFISTWRENRLFKKFSASGEHLMVELTDGRYFVVAFVDPVSALSHLDKHEIVEKS